MSAMTTDREAVLAVAVTESSAWTKSVTSRWCRCSYPMPMNPATVNVPVMADTLNL